MTLSQPEAISLLQIVLDRLSFGGRRPVLGSQLKLALLDEVKRLGFQFDERTLGFSNFTAFVVDTGLARVERHGVGDVNVTPISRLQRRIRPEFWRAFMGFPVEGQRRAFDPLSRKIIGRTAG